MTYRVKEEDFRAMAASALDSLPVKFRKNMNNVVVVVEDYPSAEDAVGADVPREELLGLFHGVTRLGQDWHAGASGQLPERIVLYKQNIEAACSTKEELMEEIRLTIIHEIGHYYGMSEEDIERYDS